MSEGDRQQAGWHSWVRSAEGEGAPAAAGADDDDLDVVLAWGDRRGPEDAAVGPVDDDWSVPFGDEDLGDDGPAEGPAYDDVDLDEDADLGGDGDFGELPAVPLSPSIVHQLDDLGATLRSIGDRVESLGVARELQSAAADRLDAQAEVVGRLVSRVEEVAAGVGELRELVGVVLDALPASAEGSGADVLAAIARLQAGVDALADQPAAAPAEPAPAMLHADALAGLADAVVDRLDLDALAILVVEHLSESFEVVADDPPSSA